MKRSIFSYIKIYFMMISQDFKSKMAYRGDFIISSFAMIMINFTGLLSFWLIFKSIAVIDDFKFEELIFIYGFSVLATTPMQIFFDNIWQLWIYCENGDFIKYCFKPLNLFFYYIAETFDPKGLGQFVFGLITLVYAWIKLGIEFNFVNITMTLLLLFGSSLIVIGIMVMACSFAFITIHGITVLTFFARFRDYARYPMTVFNKAFKFIFTFVLPVGFMAYYPSLFFLRQADYKISLITPIVGIVFFYLSYKLWMRLALKYAGTGT